MALARGGGGGGEVNLPPSIGGSPENNGVIDEVSHTPSTQKGTADLLMANASAADPPMHIGVVRFLYCEIH